jgi:cytochrome b pre-mRNA-processing protein 3
MSSPQFNREAGAVNAASRNNRRMSVAFRRNPSQEAAERAYLRVVEQARLPVFFTEFEVPDTLDGRFELICLHAFLFLHRLKTERPGSTALGQRFFDTMFADFDRSLREIGTGDLSVGRQVKRMAEGFYGRIQAYETGLDADGEALDTALARNLYGTASPAPTTLEAMQRYLRREAARLTAQPTADLLRGDIEFGAP